MKWCLDSQLTSGMAIPIENSNFGKNLQYKLIFIL